MTTIKDDEHKIDPTLVPVEIIYAIAEVRNYGVMKYKDPENWKKVEPKRYIAACYRHWLEFIANPKGVDTESGLPHLWHVACNIAFLCDQMKRGEL